MQAITFLVDEFVPFLLQLRIQIYFLPCNPNITSLWHCNFSSIPLSRMEKIAKEGYTEQCRLPSWISPFIWLAAAIASADADMRRILHQAIPSGMPAPKGFCIRLFVTKKRSEIVLFWELILTVRQLYGFIFFAHTFWLFKESNWAAGLAITVIMYIWKVLAFWPAFEQTGVMYLGAFAFS